MPDAVQQFAFRKPAATLARCQGGGRHAVSAALGTIGAGELAIALDLALLTEHTRKHPLMLRATCLLSRRHRVLEWLEPPI